MSPGYRGIKPEKVKSELRELEHVRYGRGVILELRQLDGGEYAAAVRFGDRVVRVLRLEQRYWVTNVASLLPAPPKPERRAARKKPVEIEEVGDADDGAEVNQ